MLTISFLDRFFLQFFKVLKMSFSSLLIFPNIEATQFNKVEVNVQRLRRWSIISSWIPHDWHLDGPTKPFFLRFSQVRIFLCCTIHTNNLIFIQWEFCHRSFYILLGFGKLCPVEIPLASLRLKLSSPFLPHLSWSVEDEIKIFLFSRINARASTWAFKGVSSL